VILRGATSWVEQWPRPRTGVTGAACVGYLIARYPGDGDALKGRTPAGQLWGLVPAGQCGDELPLHRPGKGKLLTAPSRFSLEPLPLPLVTFGAN
jgi:hypothetical protein